MTNKFFRSSFRRFFVFSLARSSGSALLIAWLLLILSARAATSPSDPTTLWTVMPFPPNVVTDYLTDQQTGAEEGDIIGAGDMPAIYINFIPGNSPTNGTIGFRIRVGKDASPAGFKSVMHVGVDGDLNGSVDVFMSVDNSGSSDAIRIFRAGAGANVSPSTTSIDSQHPLFSYSTSSTNYDWSMVNSTIDPGVLTSTNANPTNLDGASGPGETDFFVSYFVPFSDLVSALATAGVPNVTTNKMMQYVIATSTQPNSLNQDLNGLNGGVNSDIGFTNIFSRPILPGGATNRPPVAQDDVASTSRNTPVTIDPLVNDSDPDTNTITIVSATTTNGTVVILGGTNLIFTPATNFVGVTVLTYTISDGTTNTASANITVTVTSNTPPTAVNDNATTPEDTPVTIHVLANDSDPDGDPLTITSAFATNGTVSIVGTNLLFTPATNFNGTASITYTISDGNGGTASATVTINVTPVNDPPVAVNDNATTPEDTPVTIHVLANDSDPDGDPLTIISAFATNGTVSIVGTNLLFTPATNFNGTASITYTISDGNGGTASATVTINVTPVNDPPVAVNDNATTPEDTPVTIHVLANDSDPDGDPLTIISAFATNGTVSIVGTNLLFTPATNFNGTASITYTISDGNGGTASATVTINVTPVNDPPVAVNDSATTSQNTPVTIHVLANDSDPDGDPLTIISAFATNGTVSIVGTNLLFTPATNFNGTATISYTISDGNGGTGSALVTVTVTPALTPLFGIRQGTNVFNPQTGLFEQSVTVTNIGGATAAAVRLLVGGLRTNVFLYNAAGTNGNRPYVQYNNPLDPGQTVLFVLEFYVVDRKPFTNSLEAQAVLPVAAGTNSAGAVTIDRYFLDTRIAGDTRFVLEFDSIPGRVYTVIYSDDGMVSWKAATPSITANANRTQWYDDGTPKTDSKPESITSRDYRVILSPANP